MYYLTYCYDYKIRKHFLIKKGDYLTCFLALEDFIINYMNSRQDIKHYDIKHFLDKNNINPTEWNNGVRYFVCPHNYISNCFYIKHTIKNKGLLYNSLNIYKMVKLFIVPFNINLIDYKPYINNNFEYYNEFNKVINQISPKNNCFNMFKEYDAVINELNNFFFFKADYD